MSYTRTTEKRYPMVEFTTEIFEESFTLPRFDSLPLKVIRNVGLGEFNPLIEFVAEHGGEDAAEAFDEMNSDDLPKFLESWQGAEELPVPKSKKSAS